MLAELAAQGRGWAERRLGTAAAKSAQLRDLHKRNRLLEQKNEVLRRAAAYLSQAYLPGEGSTRA